MICKPQQALYLIWFIDKQKRLNMFMIEYDFFTILWLIKVYDESVQTTTQPNEIPSSMECAVYANQPQNGFKLQLRMKAMKSFEIEIDTWPTNGFMFLVFDICGMRVSVWL